MMTSNSWFKSLAFVFCMAAGVGVAFGAAPVVGNLDAMQRSGTNLVDVTYTLSCDDTDGEAIADHKHIFQNKYHYLVFSIAGDGDGGNLWTINETEKDVIMTWPSWQYEGVAFYVFKTNSASVSSVFTPSSLAGSRKTTGFEEECAGDGMYDMCVRDKKSGCIYVVDISGRQI